ncbi:MAG: hypothetical protein ACK4ND_11190 [Cytophagaceae bacterium]
MLKGHALFVVIIISLIIGLLSGSVIFIAYYHRITISDSLVRKQMLLNTDSAVNLILSSDEQFPSGEEFLLDLFDEENDSIWVKTNNWGLYRVAAIKSFNGKRSFYKAFQYGMAVNKAEACALYLADHNNYLSLAGNTFIRGKCYLPLHGVKGTKVANKYFEGEKLIHGPVLRSKEYLPVPDKGIISGLLSFFAVSGTQTSLPFADSLNISFFDPTFRVEHHELIRISHKLIKGNVHVFSSKGIIIESDAIIEDAVFVAPYIRIENGFKGNLQAFATDSLVVGSSVSLNYPSVVGLLKNKYSIKTPYIFVGENVNIQGVLFTRQIHNDDKKTMVKIPRTTEIEGEVYVDGYMDLQGKVFGSVYCENITLKTYANIYKNVLFDATIDLDGLSNFYVGSALLPAIAEKRMVKWLR